MNSKSAFTAELATVAKNKNRELILAGILLIAGCESAHVGMGIPIPGPVKPSVGVSVDKSGVKGHGGVSAKAGPVPISVSGSTKPIKMTETSKPTKSTQKSK